MAITDGGEEETITLTKDDYDEMCEDLELLNCLRACGVDSWEGWDSAIEMLGQEEE